MTTAASSILAALAAYGPLGEIKVEDGARREHGRPATGTATLKWMTPEASRGVRDVFRGFLDSAEAVALRVDVAATWYATLEVDSVAYSEFGTARPPFAHQWVEWITAPRAWIDGEWRDRNAMRLGAMVELLSAAKCGRNGHEDLVISGYYAEYPRLGIIGTPLATKVHLVNGQVEFTQQPPCRSVEHLYDSALVGPEFVENYADEYVKTILYAFSLMNCRNVATSTEIEDHKPSRKTRRPRPLPPRIEWRTIVLPAKPGTHHAGSGKPGDPQPHHLVRGHFKTYTPEAPLMGKHVGTYWWGWQARGNKEHGERKHLYDLSGAA